MRSVNNILAVGDRPSKPFGFNADCHDSTTICHHLPQMIHALKMDRTCNNYLRVETVCHFFVLDQNPTVYAVQCIKYKIILVQYTLHLGSSLFKIGIISYFVSLVFSSMVLGCTSDFFFFFNGLSSIFLSRQIEQETKNLTLNYIQNSAREGVYIITFIYLVS